jgi:restriction system protein
MGSQVQQLIGAAVTNAIDRAILLTNARYSRAAWEMVRRDLPLQIELLDLDAIQAWVARLQVDDDIGNEIRELIRVISKEFAIRIARDSAALDHLEWRDLERTLAEIFEGIGFSVTLTPPAKDGGRDLILKCYVKARKAEYLVEVKHWRSRSRVGGGALRDFLKVVAREQSAGGLFLATYGYCDNAFEQLTEIDRERLRFGEEEKIVALARSYVKAQSGIWSPPENLVNVLFEGTT